MEFINDFREVTKTDDDLVVDLKPIQVLAPDAALVFAAELDRWRHVKGIQLRPWKQKKWNQQIRRLLSEMGLFELLQLKGKPRVIDRGAIRFIQFISGNKSDGQLAAKLILKIKEVFPRSDPGYTDQLYDGLSEAMTNVIQHAYPQDGYFPYEIINNQFWLSGSFDYKINRATVMVYDQGVGIPATLPQWGKYAKVIDLLNLLKKDKRDANLIEAALEVGTSRMKEEHRGTGLPELIQFSEKVKGELRIISGSGEVVHKASIKKKSTKTHVQPLFGTFIEWTFDWDKI